jgi:hypothetical protein
MRTTVVGATLRPRNVGAVIFCDNIHFKRHTMTVLLKVKVKQSLYTPLRRFGGEEVIAPTHSRRRY